VLARLGDRAVAVRQGRLLATAFHPELTGDRRVHRLFVDGLREAARRAVIEEGGLGVGAQ
jgi:5'-phosphate synthase pdxT subunit